MATLVNGKFRNTAIFPSTSYAMSVCARIFQNKLQKKDGDLVNILVVQDDIESDVLPFQMLFSNRKLTVVSTEGCFNDNIFEALKETEFDILCVPHVFWTNGQMIG